MRGVLDEQGLAVENLACYPCLGPFCVIALVLDLDERKASPVLRLKVHGEVDVMDRRVWLKQPADLLLRHCISHVSNQKGDLLSRSPRAIVAISSAIIILVAAGGFSASSTIIIVLAPTVIVTVVGTISSVVAALTRARFFLPAARLSRVLIVIATVLHDGI